MSGREVRLRLWVTPERAREIVAAVIGEPGE